MSKKNRKVFDMGRDLPKVEAKFLKMDMKSGLALRASPSFTFDMDQAQIYNDHLTARHSFSMPHERRRLTVEQFQAVAARCRYKPGSKLECHRALSPRDNPYDVVWLYGTILTRDAHGKEDPNCTFVLASSRRVELAHVFDERDALEEIRRLWHQVETHEADEWFRYGDETPFDPHRGEPRP